MNKSQQVTIHTLAALRLKLNYAKDQYRMAQARAENTMLHAYTCEDILKARQEGKLFWSVLDRDGTDWEFKWFVTYRPWAFKFLAVCAGLLSLFSFIGICSCMKGADNSASIYFNAVHDPDATPGGIVIFIFISLGYTSYITCWALFQMNFAGLMILVRYSTTPESLSFNVRMIARLAAPLAFFYLGWISESGLRSGAWTQNLAPYHYELRNTTVNSTIYDAVTGQGHVFVHNVTQLTQVTGGVQMTSAFSHFYQLQDIPIIRDSFGTIFPVILICFLSLTITNVYNRLCVLVNMEKYQLGTPLPKEETLLEGKKKLKNQKDRVLRRAQNLTFASHIHKVWKKDLNDDAGGGGGGRGGGGIFGHRKGKEAALPTIEVVVPEDLFGSLERKAKSSIGFGHAWKPFYVDVKDPGVLHFYKDEASCRADFADPTMPPPLRLSLIIQMSLVTSGTRDDVELTLDFGDDKVTFRLRTLAEAERWKKVLGDWKEFSILNTSQQRASSFSDSADDAGSAAVVNKARSVSTDLAAITFDDATASAGDASPQSPAPKRSGGFGGMFGRSKNKAETAVERLTKASSSAGGGGSSSSKPKPLEGYLERKHNIGLSGGLASEWLKIFCRIDEATTSLMYFKASNLNSPVGSIDLKMANSIDGYSKGSREDQCRFNIDMGDGKVYKFRAKSAAEGEQWTSQLLAWREHFLLN